MKVEGYGDVVQREPNYCPVHDQFAPCMFCLLPEVLELVRVKDRDFYFTTSDENVN